MIFNFFTKTAYASLYKDYLELKSIEDDNWIKKKSLKPFSSNRLLIADFGQAELHIRDCFEELDSDAKKNFFKPSYNIIVQPMELNEGGIAPVEFKIYRETFEQVGGKMVIIYEGDRLLTDREVIEALKTQQYNFK